MIQMIHVLLLGMFLTHWSLLESSHNLTCGFYDEPKTWIDALRYCQKMNHTLVVLTNDAKTHVNNCLSQQGQDNIKNGVWIGLERSIFGCDVPWVWLSGKQHSDSIKDINSTDNSSHYCGKIKSNGNEVQILSGYCFDTLPFICEL